MRAIQFVETGFILPEALLTTIRRGILGLCVRGVAPKTLKQWGEDIWFTAAAVPSHVDDQPINHITTGLILINDQKARLYDDEGEFALPVGSVYRLWGREWHGTRADSNRIFAALIWDGPILDAKPAKEFALEAAVELGRRFT